MSITIIATGLHDVSGSGSGRGGRQMAKKPENGPTYSGQSIKPAASKRVIEQQEAPARSYDNGDMEIKIPEFLQKRR